MGCGKFYFRAFTWQAGDSFNGSMARECRAYRTLSQPRLAAKLGWKVRRLAAIESGVAKPTTEEITQLAWALDFPRGRFFCEGPHLVGEGFMCGEGVVTCHFCDFVADYLCDFPIGDGRTCDLPLCEAHRNPQGGELKGTAVDFCPTHVLIARGMVTDKLAALAAEGGSE